MKEIPSPKSGLRIEPGHLTIADNFQQKESQNLKELEHLVEPTCRNIDTVDSVLGDSKSPRPRVP